MARRAQRLNAFLSRTDWRDARRVPLAGDASSRRYERLHLGDGRTAVLMDAPPDGGHDVARFTEVARYLREAGFSAPEPLDADTETGFVILEDLGDDLYVRVIATGDIAETPLYEAAVDVLTRLVSIAPAPRLKPFGAVEMSAQIAPVFDWYCKGLGLETGAEDQRRIIGLLETVLQGSLRAEPAMVLRDYHAENLIWLPDRDGIRRVGLLDFQDALAGDPAYDLVSLLQDARRDLSPGLEEAMKARFQRALGLDPEEFEARYAAIGAQRNLRILGIFARLCLDQGKPRYVDFLPRVWGHVWRNLDHPGLRDLGDHLRPLLPEPDARRLAGLKAHA